jgi:hypothetical protein
VRRRNDWAFSGHTGVDKTITDIGSEDKMAVEGEVQTDLQAHVKSYGRFASMMKWGTIVSSIVTAIVVIIISS